jgi:hypothetical protein
MAKINEQLPQLIVSVDQKYHESRCLGGFIHHMPGDRVVTLSCNEIFGEHPVDIRDVKETVLALDDYRLELFAVLIKKSNLKNEIIVNEETGIISLSTMYMQILPELHVRRERRDYERLVDEYIVDGNTRGI